MSFDVIKNILESRYPKDVVATLLASSSSLKENFHLGKYKPSELEGGFFVETVRRVIEFELFKIVIGPGTALPSFTDQEMKRYEQGTGDETFRIHIPRVLRAVYNIRNKRGVGHVAGVTPNIIDSTLIMACCDWVLAELVRINSTLPIDECEELISNIVERKSPIVFEHAGIKRVLDTNKTTREQVLILLYHSGSSVEAKDLLSWTEYKNQTRFTNLLSELHDKRLLEFDGIKCILTPNGITQAERILSKN